MTTLRCLNKWVIVRDIFSPSKAQVAAHSDNLFDPFGIDDHCWCEVEEKRYPGMGGLKVLTFQFTDNSRRSL